MRVEHQLDIEAPPSIVFALNTDIERWPALTPTVTSVTRLDEGPLRAGSQALIKQPGQRSIVWTVDTLEPDHRFVWSAKATGMRMASTHLVDPTPTGARNLLRIELTGPVARLLGPLLRRKLHTVLETENEGFRREALRVTTDINTEEVNQG
jgi:carbon monoxide dehydrogenase subunit G